MCRRLVSVVVVGVLTFFEHQADAQPRIDSFGDPLPDGAIGRLDTTRFRDGGKELPGFSADGKVLASGSVATTVLLWDVAALLAQPPGGDKKPLTKEQLEGLWKDLADADAAKAYQAIQKLAGAPKEAVPFLKANLKPIPRVDPKVLEQLFVDLNDDKFSIRDKATFELEKLGDLALPDLQKRLLDNPTLEMRQRMEKLLSKLQGPVTSPEVLRMLRASETLERMATPEAFQLLEAIAAGAPGHRLTEDARDAVKRLKEQQAHLK